MKKDFKVGIGDIGIAAFSFAALIRIFGVESLTPEALEAVNRFAIGIPTLLFSVFLSNAGSGVLKAINLFPRNTTRTEEIIDKLKFPASIRT